MFLTLQKSYVFDSKRLKVRKSHPHAETALTTQMKSLDMTTLRLLNLLKAKPVGILAGRELQNGFEVVGSTTT